MRARLDRLALKVFGIVLLGSGAIALVASLFSMYAINHNAFYTCDAEPRPPGALPYEAGYAGHDVTAFPVAGTVCSWNATHGNVFDTLIPNLYTTGMVWSAIVLPVAGFTLLAVAHAIRTKNLSVNSRLVRR